MFNISQDVTERKATERKLLEDRDTLQELVNEATADLKAKAQELEAALVKEKELNELQRQFVSMASHEFRTPLAIIDSTAQRLKKSADRMSSEEALKRVDKIRGAVVRMTRLMESTLTAARLEEGKVAIDMQSCDVGQVISEVCLRSQEISKDHIISFEMGALPKSIKADASALDQILTNLLSNAVKYAPGAPDIQVKVFGEGDHVIIQVRDHGLGIDEDDLPNMFGRFFRAKTSTGIVGTGIGLNLVKTLVEMHGGTVSIDSKKDEGSTFTVRLPVDGPSPSEKAA
jgi:signal transduction histidine kinase